MSRCEPTLVTAGDRWQWTHEDYQHPSDAWTLSYGVIGIGGMPWDPAWSVPDGAGFLITVPPVATGTLPTGTYRFYRLLTSSDARASIELPRIQVQPDPEQMEAGDTLTWAEKTLASLEEAIAALTANGAISYYQIGRRIYQRTGLDMMMDQRARLKSEIAATRQGARGGLGRRVLVTFRDAGRR